MYDIKEHEGYMGVFTRNQCENAKFQNGSRVVKVWGEPNDAHPLGTKGAILGSVGHPEVGNAYFVEWDVKPGVAVLVMEKKLGAE
jgi:hypothetical protein